MKNVAIALVALSVLGFLMAVGATFMPIADITPEGFSRASNNLALIAIALIIVFPSGETTGE